MNNLDPKEIIAHFQNFWPEATVTAAIIVLATFLASRRRNDNPSGIVFQSLSRGYNSVSSSDGAASYGKFDVPFEMPSGTIHSFHEGLSQRIGVPHLEFLKAMEAEHTSMAGCDMLFTTHNYGITTTARTEWGIVVERMKVPDEQMTRGRVIPQAEHKFRSERAMKAGLRKEEVLAIIMYTGPMYVIYNCVLSRFSLPPSIWTTLEKGNNMYTTTLSVLVSAVQKLSAISVIKDGLKLYRGTGGLGFLPRHFLEPDEYNCRGMTEWGFMSCTEDLKYAIRYSGVLKGRPHCMVLEIEPSCVDRGAFVHDFSQYPQEVETIFLPMSFIAPSGPQRLQKTENGNVTIIPVRVSLNLKAERLEGHENKKKSIHIRGFQFRVHEMRLRLQKLAEQGNAEARLTRDRSRQGRLYSKRNYTVHGYIDSLVKKVEAVCLRHEMLDATNFSNDAIYRSLVSESLDAVQMAESALLWWLQDESPFLHLIQEKTLLSLHRRFESFLRLRYSRADGVQSVAEDLCRCRKLLVDDANELDANRETRLISSAASGRSADDLKLLVAAGASPRAVVRRGQSAIHVAAQLGYAASIEVLLLSGADCNHVNNDRQTPLWMACLNGHLMCVEVLLQARADVDMANKYGRTPLFMASQNGHLDVVVALVRSLADVNKADDNGVCPIHIAERQMHRRIVDVLLQRVEKKLDDHFDDDDVPSDDSEYDPRCCSDDSDLLSD
jgi:hypothetical protein